MLKLRIATPEEAVEMRASSIKRRHCGREACRCSHEFCNKTVWDIGEKYEANVGGVWRTYTRFYKCPGCNPDLDIVLPECCKAGV